MGKSGIANKVTRERYQTIKDYIEKYSYGPKDDDVTKSIFGIGQTTLRTIRNTKDYDEYLARIKKWHKKSQKPSKENVTQKSELELIEPSDEPDRALIKAMIAVILVIILVWVLIWLAVGGK